MVFDWERGLVFESANLLTTLSLNGVQVGKFNADGAQKAYAKENLQLQSYPTVLFFPKNSSQIIKYPSENREVGALLGFVEALQ